MNIKEEWYPYSQWLMAKSLPSGYVKIALENGT
jgi:hypothetical protein